MQTKIFHFVIILAFTGLDQLIKVLVRKFMTFQTNIELIPSLINLVYVENKGVSFSFLGNLPDNIRVPLLVGISSLVVLGILTYLYRSWETQLLWEKWGYSLIISGAIGNLIDRAFRQSVTDYMYFHFGNRGFFVNNLADDFISIGFVILLWKSFQKKEGE
ncbi:MAG: signal peptidase II [bacterium]|jgi:signal peptidase II